MVETAETSGWTAETMHAVGTGGDCRLGNIGDMQVEMQRPVKNL